MNENAKKLLIGSGIAVAAAAGAAAISGVLAGKLVKTALDREPPKTNRKAEKRLAGSFGYDGRFDEYIAAASEKLRESGCERVEITAGDGVRLVGHLRRSENAKRLIIAMHGWRSSWSYDFGGVSDFWHDNGCSVLYAEQRGQGESGGEYMGFGLIERYDCLDWVRWANENGFSGLPVYLCGISMGASTVLMAAGLELPGNVCGIMADCGYTSPYAIWKHVVENNLHLLYGGIPSAVADDICRRKIRMGAREYSCTDAMRECKVPVLFVHGTDDRFVPVEMTYENYKACASPKRLVIVPGAGHGMSYLVDKEACQRAHLEFWRDFDGCAPEAGREGEY